MRIYIGLGSNEGDRNAHLQFALENLENRVGKIVLRSSWYTSEPWGFESTNGFINAVVALESDLSPEDLLATLHQIEAEAGRVRKSTSHYTDRTLDLDILYIDDQRIETETLKVPHPAIADRKFVLLPMHEISPDWWDVRQQQTIENLLKSCTDYSTVNKTISI